MILLPGTDSTSSKCRVWGNITLTHSGLKFSRCAFMGASMRCTMVTIGYWQKDFPLPCIIKSPLSKS